jgi:hypothetical protein
VPKGAVFASGGDSDWAFLQKKIISTPGLLCAYHALDRTVSVCLHLLRSAQDGRRLCPHRQVLLFLLGSGTVENRTGGGVADVFLLCTAEPTLPTTHYLLPFYTYRTPSPTPHTTSAFPLLPACCLYTLPTDRWACGRCSWTADGDMLHAETYTTSR